MEPSARARVRAALLAVVVAVHGWMAAPFPHRITEAAIARPEGQEELRRWHALLVGLGADLAPEELGDVVVRTTDRVTRLRHAPLKPVRPLLRLTGTGQAWALFSSPDTHPNRLEIHARVDGTWAPVFRRLDPEHDFLAPALTYRRLRGVYEVGRVEGSYGAFARWAADRVFAEVPEADAVRVRQVRLHSTRPGAPRDGAERPRLVQIVERP